MNIYYYYYYKKIKENNINEINLNSNWVYNFINGIKLL